MKKLKGDPFDRCRDTSDEVREHYGLAGDDTCGVFDLPRGLRVIASCGGGWDHVSVSRKDRCPTWEEMVYVKRMFFKDDEWCVEYHPPSSENISVHPFCLHLWRPNAGQKLPIPDPCMVG